jgi:3-keto-disaccharide hydrolase
MSFLQKFAALGAAVLCAVAAWPELCLADEAAKPVVPAGRTELFNGRDFSGWTFCLREGAEPTNTWSVADGVIRCSGKGVGYLRTETSFQDYRLTVEWRFVKVAPRADNTGVLVHIQSPDKVWPACVQCQGKHDAQGDLFLMGGAESKEHRGKDANTALPKNGSSNEKPVGEWNTCELACSGAGVRAWINGRLMNETTECTVSSGSIGIQSEGAEFEIRKVSLEPLKP